MPPTNQHIAAARRVYEIYWDSYLKGELETFASTLDENYEMIGTSEGEIAHNKADGIAFFKSQMQEMAGKAEMRNRQISAKPVNEMLLINEHCDIFVLAGTGWAFYSKIRISTFLYETPSGWKVVQQHGSLPDMRVQEGETLAIDKISRENVELRDAVKRRTAELEHKNWELEIEAALERVRTIAMGMKKPDDLMDVCRIISKQLELLKIGNIRNVQVAIIDEPKKIYANYQYFSAYAKSVFEETVYADNKASSEMVRAMQKSVNSFFIGSIKGDELQRFREWRKDHNQLPDPILDDLPELFYYFYSIGQGGLGLTTYRAINENELEIFKRFHLVFKLAYSRFMDIQKAEAQAREAQIEVAVERVRAQSMAMHHPDDLNKVNKELLTQLTRLEISGLTGVSFYLIDQNEIVTVWDLSSPGNMTNPNSYSLRYDSKKNPVLGEFVEILKSTNEDYFILDYPKEKLLLVIEEFKGIDLDVANMFANAVESGALQHQWNPAARITDGMLSIDLIVPPNSEIKTIVLKMAGAFNLAYQRFLDLKKAEAQTREAQIEAALEKVRGVALSLQKSDEMLQVAQVLYEQLLELGFNNIRNAIIDVNNGSTDTFTDYDYSHEMSGTITQMSYHDDPTLEGQFKEMATTTNDFFELILEGKELEDLKRMRLKNGEAPDDRLDNIDLLTYNLYSFGQGAIGISNFGVLSKEEKTVLSRFNNVFTFAYKRYCDMVQTEYQAREVQIELALERIRSQVTAMQESSGLLDIVVSMRTEFVALNHEAHYFWYMRWLPEKYEKAMTSGDGTRIGMIMSLPRHIHGDVKLVADWEKSNEPTVVFAMDEETAVDYVHKMITLGDFKQVDPQAPTLDDIRNLGGLTFIMARTTHGEIGFSLPGEVRNPSNDAVNTLARFAGVFDLAYKRFEDLKTAEKDIIEIKAAKQKAEEALTELKATQTQLIQQEKLASLGQLTAGIAHEIKNPLNFVNNFSEVSIEMIEEALEELANSISPHQSITDILNDIESNLRKIHEHGTRANGIVSSMLQHSRGGSGKMEPTDLNALIKEYVNLSFHGMRAGKNPINVDIQLDLDDSYGKIALIEEDFSRVLLNLCNNAFDAMREKTKTDPDYKPLLSISTKQLEKTVEIAITDNGPGIPDEIKDKILQPFFTTKKGTEGTGLGLSITHDIVKAHGGEIKIKSYENEGTEFTIELPI